jgi:hypothetical protein
MSTHVIARIQCPYDFRVHRLSPQRILCCSQHSLRNSRLNVQCARYLRSARSMSQSHCL